MRRCRVELTSGRPIMCRDSEVVRVQLGETLSLDRDRTSGITTATPVPGCYEAGQDNIHMSCEHGGKARKHVVRGYDATASNCRKTVSTIGSNPIQLLFKLRSNDVFILLGISYSSAGIRQSEGDVREK